MHVATNSPLVMPSSLENSRPTRPRGTDEEFVLYLRGIPAHCRWQELKDLVRQTALHIRQAVVYDDRHGFPTGLGQIIVKNEEEAWRTYQKLSTNGWEGQSLTVTLARTSSPTNPIAGPTKSPSCIFPPVFASGYSTPPRASQNLAVTPSPMSPERPALPTSTTYPNSEYGHVLPPMGIPYPHHHHHNIHPYLPIYTDTFGPPMPGLPPTPPFPPDPIYFTILPGYPMQVPRPNTGRLPTRPRKPFYNPSRRAIFIQNLHPATTAKDLKEHLQQHHWTDPIEACEVFSDAETGRCKGYARVTFQNAEEAKRAAWLFNGDMFMGLRIRVKMDRFVGRANDGSTSPGVVVGGCEDGDAAGAGAGATAIIGEQQYRVDEKQDISKPVAGDKSQQQQQPLVVNGSGVGARKTDGLAELAYKNLSYEAGGGIAWLGF